MRLEAHTENGQGLTQNLNSGQSARVSEAMGSLVTSQDLAQDPSKVL